MSAATALIIALAFSQTTGSPAHGKPEEAPFSNILMDDGPHVYRQNDSTSAVIYYLQGHLVHKIFNTADTLFFTGFGSMDQAEEYCIPAVPVPSASEYDDVPAFMAISDVHGDYESLTDILINSGVMDSSGSWAWGQGHLVINGDVFDRGTNVTECLWLIYRLQREAVRYGGAVHFLLGNHELMVLRRDLRYVHSCYIKGITSTGIAYDELFGPRMELGRWLRSLPTVIRINETLFVHGGLPPDSLMPLMPMDEINTLASDGFDLSSIELKFNSSVKKLYGALGPFWYRGYHYEIDGYYPLASEEEIDQILEYYDASRIVVGHSEQDSIATLYNGRVIAIDVPVDELGGLQALLFRNGRFFTVDPDGSRKEIE